MAYLLTTNSRNNLGRAARLYGLGALSVYRGPWAAANDRARKMVPKFKDAVTTGMGGYWARQIELDPLGALARSVKPLEDLLVSVAKRCAKILGKTTSTLKVPRVGRATLALDPTANVPARLTGTQRSIYVRLRAISTISLVDYYAKPVLAQALAEEFLARNMHPGKLYDFLQANAKRIGAQLESLLAKFPKPGAVTDAMRRAARDALNSAEKALAELNAKLVAAKANLDIWKTKWTGFLKEKAKLPPPDPKRMVVLDKNIAEALIKIAQYQAEVDKLKADVTRATAKRDTAQAALTALHGLGRFYGFGKVDGEGSGSETLPTVAEGDTYDWESDPMYNEYTDQGEGDGTFYTDPNQPVDIPTTEQEAGTTGEATEKGDQTAGLVAAAGPLAFALNPILALLAVQATKTAENAIAGKPPMQPQATTPDTPVGPVDPTYPPVTVSSGMPGWVLPVAIGVGVVGVGFVLLRKK